ncbi:hypothetical protein EV177_006111 [Coemansia sp. RSA 1804]|nr:hypothetical protein EV177_006111 [Coemansia sp. RSA 1804]
MSTPKTEHRDRINTLRKFFFKTDNDPQPGDTAELVEFATPVQIKSYSGMVVDPDLDSKQPKHGDLVYPPGQVVQITSVDRTGGSSNVPTSPSPIRRNIASTTGAPLSTLSPINDSSDSVSSLLVDLADEDQNQDENKPIPFVLNQGVGNPHLNPNNSGSSGEQSLKTLSMRLNSSIAAINCGLREQLEGGKELSGCGRDDIGVVLSTMDNATGQLNQSLASLISGTNAEHISFGKHSTLKNSKLELQLETLRRSMEDTKSIVFAIQKEICRIQQQEHGQKLDQQHDNHQQLPNDSSSEDSKLDDILGLLGALDMRLHMLEGRQRLEQNASTASQRSNTGSTKVYANSRQQGSVQEQCQSRNRQQDIISRIGQLAVHCLNRYPLMIIGMLFIILLSELLIIGGYSLSTQSMRGIGKYALNEVKRHIPMPPPPPS